MEKTNLKIGDTVWVDLQWEADTRAEVTSLDVKGHDDYIQISVQETANNKKPHPSNRRNVSLEDCYPTKEALRAGIKAKSDAAVDEYCSQVSNVEGLVRLMYDSVLYYSAETDDYDLRKAVGIKAQELLGIDLDKEYGLIDLETAVQGLEGEAQKGDGLQA